MLHLGKQITKGIGLIFLLSGTGCVTSTDLERLNQGVTSKLESVSSAVRSEMGGLRAELATHAKRQQDLTNALDSLKSTIQTDIDALHRQFGTFQLDTRTAFEDVRAGENVSLLTMKELKADAAKTKKALDDYAARTQQDIGRIESFTGDVSKQLRGVWQELSTFSTNVEKLSPLVKSLSTEMHALTRTLLGSYRLEEAALRDRLKTLEQLTKQIEPVAVSQQTEAVSVK